MKKVALIAILLAAVSMCFSCKGDGNKYTSILSDNTDKLEFEVLNKLFARFEHKLKNKYKVNDLNEAIRLFVSDYNNIEREFYSDKGIAGIIKEYKQNWNTVQEIEKDPQYISYRKEIEANNKELGIEESIVIEEEYPIAEEYDKENSEEKENLIILNPYGKLYKGLELSSQNKTLSIALETIRQVVDISPAIIAGGFVTVLENELTVTDATMMSIFLLLYVQQAINYTE